MIVWKAPPARHRIDIRSWQGRRHHRPAAEASCVSENILAGCTEEAIGDFVKVQTTFSGSTGELRLRWSRAGVRDLMHWQRQLDGVVEMKNARP